MYDEDGDPTEIVFTFRRGEVRVSATRRTVRADIEFDQRFRPEMEEGQYRERLKFSLSVLIPEAPPFLLSKEAAEDATLDEVIDYLGNFISVYLKTVVEEGKKKPLK